jgi:hypothetical protein
LYGIFLEAKAEKSFANEDYAYRINYFEICESVVHSIRSAVAVYHRFTDWIKED